MPYITQTNRAVYDTNLNAIIPCNTGELNYCITRLIENYLQEDRSYAYINSVVGALECAKLEFYRRLAAPYENQKAFENGDIGMYE